MFNINNFAIIRLAFSRDVATIFSGSIVYTSALIIFYVAN